MREHYTELSALLRTVRNRWRAVTALRAWSIAAVAVAVVLALARTTHAVLAPDGPALVILWVCAALAGLACLAWMIVPLRRIPGDRQVARFVEECCPELEDTLVTAVAEHDASPTRPMLPLVVSDALRRARTLDLDHIVSRGALRRAGMSAAAATIGLFVLGVFSAGPAGRAARLFAIYLFPDRIALKVTPGDVKLRAGQGLRITAHVPGGGSLVPLLRFTDGNRWREARMEAPKSGQGFVFWFDKIERGFKYAVTAATASSREYSVTVVRPPHVRRIDLRYEYPSAFGLKPRVEEDSGDIYGPAGTRVQVVIQTDKPVTSASLNLTGGETVQLNGRGDRAEGELTISEDGSYRVALADADGLSNSGDTEYFIRTLEDRPPDVRVMRPAGDKQVTPLEEVPIEARADDDFGIASFDLVYSVRGGPEKSVPFNRDSASPMTVNGQRTMFLEDLGVQPGDFVTYYARARDVSRGKRSSEARSDIFFLEVKPFEEEFVAAQSQAMPGGQGDRSLDDLAAAQKEIIVATWKLDARGRNARARSEEDIRNVARAQSELRRRAQGAAGLMQRSTDPRRRRVAPNPDDPSRQADATGADDPMTKAVEAMGKASQQLEALKTSDALPHEMTALNELLRAQAEIRKRQVQRQANSMGGRFQNRQQQDLSSLFDRELARQQSNYETPNSSEAREEKSDDNDVLDRIRELARRQDALNREQQELARKRDNMTEEELRRQLEKLTREQSELRRQAEELSRRMQQGQQASRSQSQSEGQTRQRDQGKSQGGRDQSAQQASRALGQISEEMQGATSDLRRQDPNHASARGTRALERLRELEQRMRSTQPDDRRRARGELQLESRQLADAQRQLANERQRDGQSASSADQARRRAAEQDRLADRMERLEQAVKQMATESQSADDDERKAMQDAAREVERQKLADRMRGIARAEREAGGSQAESQSGQQGSAQSGAKQNGEKAQQGGQSHQRTAARDGQEISKALERLADRLGSANGQTPEARRLSEQLSRMRNLRERVDDVDRQIAELRRNGGERREGSDAKPEPQQSNEHRQSSAQGQVGQSGQQGTNDGGRGGEISQPQDSSRPWEQTRELLEQLRRQEGGVGLNTPEMQRFNPGLSAPGTEAWKQDFATWEELKKQIDLALEKAETSTASQLREQQAKDRLNAGTTQAVPEEYRRLVDKYYRALAQKKK
jgi:hypothetical protein